MARSVTRYQESVLVTYCLSGPKVALILYHWTGILQITFLFLQPAAGPCQQRAWRKTTRLGGQEGTFPSGVLFGPVARGWVCRSPSSTQLWGGGLMFNGGARGQVSLSIQLRCSPSSAANEYHLSDDFQGQPGVNFSFAGPPLRFWFLLLSLSLSHNSSNLLAVCSMSIILGVLFLLFLVVSHFLIQLTVLCTNLFNLVPVF